MFEMKGEKVPGASPGLNLASGISSTTGLPLPSVTRERREPETGEKGGKPLFPTKRGLFSCPGKTCLLEKWVLRC